MTDWHCQSIFAWHCQSIKPPGSTRTAGTPWTSRFQPMAMLGHGFVQTWCWPRLVASVWVTVRSTRTEPGRRPQKQLSGIPPATSPQVNGEATHALLTKQRKVVRMLRGWSIPENSRARSSSKWWVGFDEVQCLTDVSLLRTRECLEVESELLVGQVVSQMWAAEDVRPCGPVHCEDRATVNIASGCLRALVRAELMVTRCLVVTESCVKRLALSGRGCFVFCSLGD